MKIKSIILLFICTTFISANAQNIGLIYNEASEKTAFAVQEIERSLKVKGVQSAKYAFSQLNKKRAEQTSIVLISLNEKNAPEIIKKAGIKNASELKEEGFLVQNTDGTSRDNREGGQKVIYILGKDEAGLMYGDLKWLKSLKFKAWGLSTINCKIHI
jgi:alpha-glucuronidase